jgi:hypothetical protein
MLTEIAKEVSGAVRYALEGWSRTARACCLVGAVSAAATLFYRFR